MIATRSGGTDVSLEEGARPFTADYQQASGDAPGELADRARRADGGARQPPQVHSPHPRRRRPDLRLSW